MSATTKVRAARQSRLRWLVHSDIVSVATAGAVAVGVGFALLRSPETIDTVSVTNPTGYDIGVEVRGAEGGWMPMSTAQPNTTTVVKDVIDQGSSWTIRFTAQGQQAGQLELRRQALEAAGWEIEIPASTEEFLRDASALPPP
jgi:hypothetical protein